ncbi:hypothetical protein TrCOL_g3762 [Triparma columacea]|uniref:Uncharacterized protein n=1 Tax=Triparma columacea TaxID=722753 RepID=A0A9W7G8L5_9STRA|nr:hypothetical protein TrCOL_g3762 [Triparma columacea]
MLTVDRKVPWGRPSEDVIARRRSRKAHTLHRQRLKDTSRQVDSNEPETTNMTHLRVRAKKRQMADDRLQEIANENRKLMEKMSAIMRNKGPAVGRGSSTRKKSPTRLRPLQRGEAIYNKGGLHTAVRKREQNRIANENRAILARIKNGKNTRSYYDHARMGKEEKERLKYIKNISKSYQRDVRVQKAQARRSMLQNSASLNAPSFDVGSRSYGGGEGYGQIMDGAMKVTLHTARQIREDVATKRGMPLPDLMSKRPGESKNIGGRGKGQGVGKVGSEKTGFTLQHSGAPGGGGYMVSPPSPNLNITPGFGSLSLDGGLDGGMEGFGDYDYESAEGGRFEGRGYSRGTGDRPSTTAQSTRSQVSKE